MRAANHPILTPVPRRPIAWSEDTAALEVQMRKAVQVSLLHLTLQPPTLQLAIPITDTFSSLRLGVPSRRILN